MALFGPRTVNVYCLIALTALGAFSRFTHGRYTPWFYEFQNYHAPDDGGTVAQITPVLDSLVCLMLLYRRTRAIAALLALGFTSMGMYVQYAAGKEYLLDGVMVAVAAMAALDSWS